MAHCPPPPRFYDWPPHWADLARRVDRLAEIVHEMGEKLMADLAALTAQVTETTAVEASALTLIQGIAQRLTDAAGDPAAVAALAAELNTSATALSEAVTANTPAPVDVPPVDVPPVS